MVCFLSIFFSFLSVFSLTDINDSEDRRDGRGNHYFSCFPLPPANEHSFNSSRFLPLIFTRSICNYQTDSWWDLFSLDICILFAFLWMHLSRSYWLWHFKVTVRIWAHIKLSPFYYKANALTNWDLHTLSSLSIYHTHPVLPLAATCIRNHFIFFTIDWNKKWCSYLYQPDRYWLNTVLVKP